MLISHASFGLVTQLLDFAAPLGQEPSSSLIPHPTSLEDWQPVLEWIAALGAGALAEEVTLGDETTIPRFVQLQREARAAGLETFLRLRNLTDEALATLREAAAEAAAKLAPGESVPPGPRLIVDLGEPDEADLARWLPRPGARRKRDAGGPGGNWSQALAFSLFAPDGETAIRRLQQIAPPLLDAAQRPGIEQPVWLAAFGAGEPETPEDPDGTIQLAVHALALGIERVFLAEGPAGGWWPHHLRTPPAPLQAFRTLARQLDGAAGISRNAPGQYQISVPGQPERYLLWKSEAGSRPPDALHGQLEVTTPFGEVYHVEAARLKLTPEPIFVMRVELAGG
jgi:hypothetical protein